ncbi:hypothetical protein [Sphingomonas sp.]|uniref:hypothetical protein n=1 Tax=Sphingomonas sp. TaxID=28214 RepID=UPI00289EC9BD|nr:hypothetical protein [Sphingomonas sp.]
MTQRPDGHSLAAFRIGVLLTGFLIFVTLLVLDVWNIAPHSMLRAGIVGIASGMVAGMLVRRFDGPEKA